MAKNYEQIIAAINAGNRMDFGNAIERGNGVPLDKSSVYASFNDAVYYALNNPVAYEGQVIAVTEGGDTYVYVITPASQGKHKFNANGSAMEDGEEGVDIYIKLVGTVTLGDDVTIVKNDDDTLSIKGYTAASTGAQLTKTANGLEWVVPDTTTVEGLSSAITTLQGQMTAAEGDIDDLETAVGASTDVASETGSLYARIAKNKADLDKLNSGSTVEGSVAYQIAQIVAGADESFDTLKEIADWISTHGSDAATMSSNISSNASAIDALEALVGDTAVATQIANALDAALKVTQEGGTKVDKYALATELTALSDLVGNTSVASQIEGALKVDGADKYALAGHNHDADYASAEHNHDDAYAAKIHNHTTSDITDLETYVDGRITAADLATDTALQNHINAKVSDATDAASIHVSATDREAWDGAVTDIATLNGPETDPDSLAYKFKAVNDAIPTGTLASKNTVAKTDLDNTLKTEIEGKLDASEVTGDLLTHNTSEFAPAVHTHDQYLTAHQDISGKVDKVEGKGLSTNDLTDTLKSNYDAAYTHSTAAHAPANAQANIIESVKVKNNGDTSATALSIDGKSVTVDLSSYAKTTDLEWGTF